MSLTVRILCIIGAIFMFLFITNSVRKKRIQIADSIFWVLFSFLIMIIAIFPQIAISLSELIGIASPSNFVFLCIIALLMLKVFTLTATVSKLQHRVNELAQEEALLAYPDQGSGSDSDDRQIPTEE